MSDQLAAALAVIRAEREKHVPSELWGRKQWCRRCVIFDPDVRWPCPDAVAMDGVLNMEEPTPDGVRVANSALHTVLNALINRYVANRGHADAEFISCITPSKRGVNKHSDRIWKLWDDARRLTGEKL